MSKHRIHPSSAVCGECTRPVGDNASLCRDCGNELARLIGDVPALIGDLAVTYTRQGRSEKAGGSRSAETSLPWSDKASAAYDALNNEVVSLARIVHDDNPDVGAEDWPRDDPASVATWLLNHVEWMRHHEAGPSILNDLARAVSAVNHVMDLHAERWYAGPCHNATDSGPCSNELYVKPNVATIVCRFCGATYDTDDRRQWLLDQAEDRLAHMELIGRALASLGEAVTPASIRGLAARGRIVPHGVDQQGRELFRIGDVIRVVREIAMERSRRESEGARRRAERELRRSA